jgi:hypothetical protein
LTNHNGQLRAGLIGGAERRQVHHFGRGQLVPGRGHDDRDQRLLRDRRAPDDTIMSVAGSPANLRAQQASGGITKAPARVRRADD